MYRPCILRCFDAQDTREGPTDTSSIHLFTCGLAVNAAISPQNRLDPEGDTRKFLVTFEHTSRCSFSGEIFHNLATNLKLIQPRTPSVSAHPKLRPRGHPLSPQSSRPQLCAVVAYFTMRTVFTIPCCIVSCWSEQVDNGKLRLFDSFHQTD